ncbi:MAG: universal stress protein [Planctomycetaceae bacterium]
MTSQQEHIDEFESLFRRAEREPFAYAEVPLKSAVIVTDGTRADAHAAADELREFAPRLETVANWRLLTGDDYANVAELLRRIDDVQTDLLVTYRHLKEQSQLPKHTLGAYLDVMTQVMTIPVLVLPGTARQPKPLTRRTCNRVMVVTDHISGDNRLINYGARLCAAGGTVWLTHIEDDAQFRRYVDAISRIPEIETEQARTLIEQQLLKEAADFIDTCITRLRADGPDVLYKSVVTRGHHLTQYRRLIEEHDADLLVANTKDEDQLAMRGMTYSLSVELTDVAMLLL